jgi:hypothetical protein
MFEFDTFKAAFAAKLSPFRSRLGVHRSASTRRNWWVLAIYDMTAEDRVLGPEGNKAAAMVKHSGLAF